MQKAIIITLVTVLCGAIAPLLPTGCASTPMPVSPVRYVYRQSQFSSRVEYLRFCDHYFTIASYEGHSPCVD
jgi:hypothetical protein